MHTLIVDDHAFVCVGLKATLLDGLSDIKVSTASDGAKALDILLNDSIDLAVIDLFMPGGDAFQHACWAFRLIPVVERLGESRHAQIGAAISRIKHKRSAVCLSHANRFP